MNSLDYYMRLNYKMEIVKDEAEKGYVVSFPELPGCTTCADTIEKAALFAEDARREWLTACIEDNVDIPLPIGDNI